MAAIESRRSVVKERKNILPNPVGDLPRLGWQSLSGSTWSASRRLNAGIWPSIGEEHSHHYKWVCYVRYPESRVLVPSLIQSKVRGIGYHSQTSQRHTKMPSSLVHALKRSPVIVSVFTPFPCAFDALVEARHGLVCASNLYLTEVCLAAVAVFSRTFH